MSSTHEHGTHQPFTLEEIISEEFWDGRYREKPQIWSGKANRYLVAEAEGLIPGRALDLGCGEGGDALWLAQHGWDVDAADISVVALERGASAAAEAGIAERIHWLHRDLVTWRPDPGYDLVSAQYIHLPPPLRKELFAAAAAAVNPGGSLLVVGHAQEAMRTYSNGQTFPADLYFTPDEITGLLGDPWLWVVETCELRGEGEHTDAVYRAKRLPG
jgi:cyclopropane fatty-acyl-phospholipid synthase-like methyltransferase